MANKPPVKEIRFGSVKAAIWANQMKGGHERFTVSVVRIYKDGALWRESRVFDRADLPLVAKACDQAHTWIYQESQNHRDEASEDNN